MMRRSWILLLPLLAVGCVDTEFKLRDAAPRGPGPISPAAISTPITAEQVTPVNARRMAQSLWDEMDREDLALPATTDKRK